MNKFEKKFIIIDFICFGSFFVYVIISLIMNSIIHIIVSLLIIFYYLFRMKNKIWNTLEKREKEFIDFTDVNSIGEAVKGQWGR